MAAYRARSGALHCAFCRYPLDGLPCREARRRRCPECGAPYWRRYLDLPPGPRSTITRAVHYAAGTLLILSTFRSVAITAFIVGAAVIAAALAWTGYDNLLKSVGYP